MIHILKVFRWSLLIILFVFSRYYYIFENQGRDLTELSFLLGEPINQIVFIFDEEDDTTSTLRAISQNYEFIIIYESVSWLPKKIIKYVKSTSYPLLTFDFLYNEVFYKIDKAIILLKEAK